MPRFAIMCLILFAFEYHPRYRLVMAANRDEFHARPTLPMDYWKTHPHILGGRDLAGGGTWLGITRRGRIAALTNYRDPAGVKRSAPSRGALVSDFLATRCPSMDYLDGIAAVCHRFNGFNLIVDDGGTLGYYGNRSPGALSLAPGVYGLSNHLLDTPWPKVERGKNALAGLLDGHGGAPVDPEMLLSMLADRTRPDDSRLPDTGVGLEWERLLSPIFISGERYGTRSSSVILWERCGRIDIWERSFAKGSDGAPKGTRRYRIVL